MEEADSRVDRGRVSSSLGQEPCVAAVVCVTCERTTLQLTTALARSDQPVAFGKLALPPQRPVGVGELASCRFVAPDRQARGEGFRERDDWRDGCGWSVRRFHDSHSFRLFTKK